MLISKEELKDLIEELAQHKGRATELVTVYIPAGQNIHTVADQLEAEKSTAKNIKSTSTRKNVGNALDKITRALKDHKKTPENGLALFSGNISKIEGQDDLRLWEIETPMPLKTRMYRCDKEFILDPLREMTEIKEIFGLLVMDRKEATIGMLEGKRVEVLQKMTSGIPSKVRAGGQSSQRFHRITEGLTRDFYKRIAEEMKKIFFENKKLKGILVGGPMPTKDEFLDGDYLTNQLKVKVLGRIDLGDTSESGLGELVERAEDILADQEIIHEKKILERFFQNLGEGGHLATLKEKDTRKALEYGAVDTLILSRELDKELSQELVELAENTGAKVEIISIDTEEGQQFNNLSGIGSILRYAL